MIGGAPNDPDFLIYLDGVVSGTSRAGDMCLLNLLLSA
jgi:hypothetical protein